MSRTETVMAFSSALEYKNYAEAEDCLAENFSFQGPGQRTFDRAGFVALMKSLESAIPTWRFNLHGVHQEGETVQAAMQITGTHSRDLTLPLEGAQPIPATDHELSMPEEGLTFAFEGDCISNIAIEQTPGGGFDALFQQLGASIA